MQEFLNIIEEPLGNDLNIDAFLYLNVRGSQLMIVLQFKNLPPRYE